MEAEYNIKPFVTQNASDAYTKIVNAITEEGHLITARNEPALELLNISVLIKNPRDRIVNIPNFNLPFILQETFDILNENPVRSMHSKEMLEKTMGNSNNIFFFGNEMRQAFSRWSLRRIKKILENDKQSRKAILDLNTRRPTLHNPCMIYAHFIIRDNKLHMTAETRGTAMSMGFPNDIFFFTLIQEILYGWLKEAYPDLKLGQFLYKTVSAHYYLNDKSIKKPLWDQNIIETKYKEYNAALSYSEYLQEMGTLYYYIDQYMKAVEIENIDQGHITEFGDVEKPKLDYFKTELYYKWAECLYYHITNTTWDYFFPEVSRNSQYVNLFNRCQVI